jgi:hypothetical protein
VHGFCRVFRTIERSKKSRNIFSRDLFQKSSGRDASDQAVAASVDQLEELLARQVNRGETREIEQHPLIWLLGRRRAPLSRQLTNPGPCELTVESKGQGDRVSFEGNHEHRQDQSKCPSAQRTMSNSPPTR